MKINETTIAIIKHLRDGRKSYKEIAEDLSIAENTVRSHVNRMTEEGLLTITGLINPEMVPGCRVIIIGIKLKSMELVKKGEEISRLNGVISVSVVTGQYDLIVNVLLREGYDLLEFFTEEMSKISDVRSVETFVVYKSYNLRVPYIL